MTIVDVSGNLGVLAAAAQAGDRAAMEQLLSRTRPQIHRYVLARLVDRDSADDVTQEVMIAVVANLERYLDTGRSPLAWMFGIAANKVSETHRAGGRRREVLTDTIVDGDEHEQGPDVVACAAETSRELAELMHRLPRPQAEILRLRIAAGLSAAETAEVLGMTAGAVRVAQHRALARLREQYLEARSDGRD